MKKLFGSLVAGALVMLGAVAAQAEEVKFGVAAEPYPPFSSKDTSGKWVGWEMDLMDEVCKNAKLDCKLVEVAWDGIIPALQEKKIDVIWSSMTITDKRKEVIDFTDFYYDGPSVMIGLAKDDTKVDYSNPDSLKGKTIGVQTSTIHADFIKEVFGNSVEMKLYDTLDNALADLAAGRLDYVSESQNTLKPFLDSHKDFKITSIHPQHPIFGYGVGGGLRKGETELKDKLNAAIKEVVTSGKWDEITNKYPELVGEMVKPTY